MKYIHSVKFKWLGTLSCLLIVLSLTSCGLSMPSESDGKKALENRIKQDSSVKQVTSFKKVNGQSSEVFGVKAYSMQYEAITEDVCSFQVGCHNYNGPDPINKGDKWIAPLKGTIEFTKSENGWNAVNVDWHD